MPALERLAQLLQTHFGELPKGRLMAVSGNTNWAAVMIRCVGGHTAYLRKEFSEAKTAQILLNWWTATGLIAEHQ